jgi:gliding motility-associated-like protein
VVKGTAVEYYWSPNLYINDNQSITPQVYPPVSMQYTLTVNSTVGCGTSSSLVRITVYNGLYVPSAFSPNGDGHNDLFRITPIYNYTLTRLSIYNRTGRMIFNTADPGTGWDGTYNGEPQPPGAYIYFIEMKLPGGKDLVEKGTVVLIR